MRRLFAAVILATLAFGIGAIVNQEYGIVVLENGRPGLASLWIAVRRVVQNDPTIHRPE